MAFPGPYAQVYYNEAGEPLGWSTEYPDEPQEMDPVEESRLDALSEAMWEDIENLDELTETQKEQFGSWWWKRRSTHRRLEDALQVWLEEQEL